MTVTPIPNTYFAKAEVAYRAARLRRSAEDGRRHTRGPVIGRNGEVARRDA